MARIAFTVLLAGFLVMISRGNCGPLSIEDRVDRILSQTPLIGKGVPINHGQWLTNRI